jgi:hypothetical protein
MRAGGNLKAPLLAIAIIATVWTVSISRHPAAQQASGAMNTGE